METRPRWPVLEATPLRTGDVVRAKDENRYQWSGSGVVEWCRERWPGVWWASVYWPDLAAKCRGRWSCSKRSRYLVTNLLLVRGVPDDTGTWPAPKATPPTCTARMYD
jgi:hypothetical protein